MSTPNLLLNRDHALKRAATFNSNSNNNNNRSTISLTEEAEGIARTPGPFMRLLPIQTEPVYFIESDESDEEEDSVAPFSEYEGGRQRNSDSRDHRVETSPTFLHGTRSVHLRSNLSDSYGRNSQQQADFQKQQQGKQADLSNLSPIDHNYPTYFGEDDVGESNEPGLQRYQLYDRPVPAAILTNIVGNTVDPQQQLLSSSVSLRSPLLDIIQEEEGEELRHSKRPSQVEDDYKEIDLAGPQPLQEANVRTLSQQKSNINTQPHIGDLYGETKTNIDRRIEQAMQQVERQFADRVQRLEAQTVSLPTKASTDQEQGSTGVPSYNSRRSVALRMELLSNASQKVEDLDTRISQMENLVSYKLNDIEYKVQELNEGHTFISSAIDKAVLNPDLNAGGMSSGNQRYHRAHIGNSYDDSSDNGSHSDTTALVDQATISELRQELQVFGTRYHELKGGLLTDLMTQMGDAKMMLLEATHEADQRLGKRVDRIETEMHTQQLSDTENRIQERVRVMEQISVRLERCFDKMEGRLGALETVLASKKPRSESMNHWKNQANVTEQQSVRSAISDPSASPEIPLPRVVAKEDNITGVLRSSGNRRTFAANPPRIQTLPQGVYQGEPASQYLGPYSAGPTPNRPRNMDRRMTVDSIQPQGVKSASTAGSHRNAFIPHRRLTASGIVSAGGPKSAGYIVSSNTKLPADLRRSSSYKELLHFWKAGGSTPNLLENAESS
ncbi:hypothetical protein BGZ58_010287 [Dissophora ornata]|nr:hypothetical protein BGZ58_010287 [Dissophora ornata]